MRESIDHNDREREPGAVVSLLEILADLDGVDDESVSLPDGGLAEAQAAAARLFGGPKAAAAGAEASPQVVSMLFTQIEGWLAESTLETATGTSRGEIATPTLDRHEPGLATYGYEPDIEIDADIDPEAATATITVVVQPVDDTAAPLVLTVTNTAGVVRRGRVNTYGVVVVHDVPITGASPNDLTLQWSVATPL
jgi:hypothetical protein